MLNLSSQFSRSQKNASFWKYYALEQPIKASKPVSDFTKMSDERNTHTIEFVQTKQAQTKLVIRQNGCIFV